MADKKPQGKPKAEPAKAEKSKAELAKEKPSPTRERQEKQRADAAVEFERQLEEGSLVIRQMTPSERKANPPRDRPPKKKKR